MKVEKDEDDFLLLTSGEIIRLVTVTWGEEQKNQSFHVTELYKMCPFKV